jgi:ribosomal protein S4
MKLEKEKLSLFFGLINKRKYIAIHKYMLNDSKIKANTIFSLIGQLTFFLFSINLHMNMYFIRNIIKVGHILVNDRIKTNPLYSISLMENVSIIHSKIAYYFNFVKTRFMNNLILFNKPSYIEVSYPIMTASI